MLIVVLKSSEIWSSAKVELDLEDVHQIPKTNSSDRQQFSSCFRFACESRELATNF